MKRNDESWVLLVIMLEIHGENKNYYHNTQGFIEERS